jgi:hypothetical protein
MQVLTAVYRLLPAACYHLLPPAGPAAPTTESGPDTNSSFSTLYPHGYPCIQPHTHLNRVHSLASWLIPQTPNIPTGLTYSSMAIHGQADDDVEETGGLLAPTRSTELRRAAQAPTSSMRAGPAPIVAVALLAFLIIWSGLVPLQESCKHASANSALRSLAAVLVATNVALSQLATPRRRGVSALTIIACICQLFVLVLLISFSVQPLRVAASALLAGTALLATLVQLSASLWCSDAHADRSVVVAHRVLVMSLLLLPIGELASLREVDCFFLIESHVVKESDTYLGLVARVGAAAKSIVENLPAASPSEAQLAAAYYAAQRRHFEAAASAFSVHPYFLGSKDGLSRHASFFLPVWHNLLVARTNSFAAQLRRVPLRDDFRIEKDKCVMQRFLETAGVPIAPMLGFTENVSLFRDELLSLRLHSKYTRSAGSTTRFFAKACHLTQASAGGVRRIGTEAWVRENADALSEWLSDSTSSGKTDDWRRPWRLAGNAITFGLRPGFFVQYPFADLTVELKVETIWGRAYVAHTGWPSYIHPSPESISTDGFVGPGTAFVSNKALPSHLGFLLNEPRYMACVWQRAQQVACLIGADQVRVDVFVTATNPHACMVNEISLNDGLDWEHHVPFMAKLWAAPYERGAYRVRGNGSVVVYQQPIHSACAR